MGFFGGFCFIFNSNEILTVINCYILRSLQTAVATK
jgi:hypothetical protein